tara:strand:+ start:403 stop:741 length:339 start_codon:yes stop_codon:yes gene_type:complete
MAVFSNNLTIHTGTDFEQTFVLEDGNTNSALDLTGYSGCAKIKKYQSSTVAGTFTLAFTNRATGKIRITMEDSVTINLKAGKYFYDVLLNSGSNVERVIEGEVLVKRAVTRP